MADLNELRRIVVRDVGSRETRGLEDALFLVMSTLEPDERVLGAATGQWFHRRRCIAVATSRKLVVADGGRVDQFPYLTMMDVEYGESWRKATLLVRGPGHVADIRGVQQERARNLRSLIQTARVTLVSR